MSFAHLGKVRVAGAWKDIALDDIDEGVFFDHNVNSPNPRFVLWAGHGYKAGPWGALDGMSDTFTAEEDCYYRVTHTLTGRIGNDSSVDFWYNMQFNTRFGGTDHWSGKKYPNRPNDWSPTMDGANWHDLAWTEVQNFQYNSIPKGSVVSFAHWGIFSENDAYTKTNPMRWQVTVHRWREMPAIHVRVNGQWKRSSDVLVRNAGAWKNTT